MEVIRLDQVSLLRRTQEELSRDLKKTIFSLFEGKYRKPMRKLVLDQINLSIQSGEKVGIIGANGSGKSTLLKLICKIFQPTRGRVWVKGKVAPLIELGAGFDSELSVIDNIKLYGVMLGFSEQEMRDRVSSILEFAELEEYATVPVKALSSGMVARLGFSIATDVQPDILILDEVLSVGDASFKNKCKQRIERFWDRNTTILLVSHDLEFIKESCERVIWLERGKISAVGDPKETVHLYLASVNLLDDSTSPATPPPSEPSPQSSEETPLEQENEEVLPAEIVVGAAKVPPPETPGSVIITDVFIANEEKQIVELVDYGSPFFIGMKYQVKAPTQNLMLGAYLTNEYGIMILEPVTQNFLPITGAINEIGERFIYVKIPAPFLRPGKYYISGVGAYEEGFGHHHWIIEKLLSFNVILPEKHQHEWFGQELVHPPLEWFLENN